MNEEGRKKVVQGSPFGVVEGTAIKNWSAVEQAGESAQGKHMQTVNRREDTAVMNQSADEQAGECDKEVCSQSTDEQAGESDKEVCSQSVSRSKEEQIKKVIEGNMGDRREYYGEEEEDGIFVTSIDSNLCFFFGGLLLVLFGAVLTRFYKISQPEHIA